MPLKNNEYVVIKQCNDHHRYHLYFKSISIKHNNNKPSIWTDCTLLRSTLALVWHWIVVSQVATTMTMKTTIQQAGLSDRHPSMLLQLLLYYHLPSLWEPVACVSQHMTNQKSPSPSTVACWMRYEAAIYFLDGRFPSLALPCWQNKHCCPNLPSIPSTLIVLGGSTERRVKFPVFNPQGRRQGVQEGEENWLRFPRFPSSSIILRTQVAPLPSWPLAQPSSSSSPPPVSTIYTRSRITPHTHTSLLIVVLELWPSTVRVNLCVCVAQSISVSVRSHNHTYVYRDQVSQPALPTSQPVWQSEPIVQVKVEREKQSKTTSWFSSDWWGQQAC